VSGDKRGDGTPAADAQEAATGFYRWLRRDDPGERAARGDGAGRSYGLRAGLKRSPPMEDAEVLERARRAKNAADFERVHSGASAIPGEFPSESERDLRLASMIAFYSQDPGQVARLMRESGCYREKMDREDYMRRTIDKALAELEETYSGPRSGATTPEPEPEQEHEEEPSAKRGKPRKPQILVTDRDAEELLEETRRALTEANTPPELFHRDRGLVAVVHDQLGQPVIHRIGRDGLRERMARAATYARTGRNGEPHRILPPEGVAAMVLARGEGWNGIPPLEKLSGVPVLRPDGEIHDRPGYERTTRTYYDPGAGAQPPPPVPGEPTDGDVADALETISEPFEQFPFVSEADRANALGLLLTPVARPSIAGPVPLAVVDKPVMGSGASLIAEVVATVATGLAEARGQCTTAEEWAKQITAALLGGAQVIVFDNIGERLDSHVLARALTADVWTERVLGESREAAIPQRATWICTSRNVQLGGDIPRRAYRVRLDPKIAQPWRRTGFKHPELLAFVRENRPRIVAAGLTLCRAWFAAGKPDGTNGRAPFGKFESWERVIGGVLAHAGVSDFLANLDEFYEDADEDAGDWEAFLAEWHEAFGTAAQTLQELYSEMRQTVRGKKLAATLPDDLAFAFKESQHRSDAGEAFARKLGYALRDVKDRRFGAAGYHATTEKQSEKSKKAKRWRVLTNEHEK
jgi:hypothetical protein